MADPEKDADDKFVEIDGVKYKEDPENEGQELIGEDGKPVPLEVEEKEKEEEETDEEKKAREKKEEDEEPSTRRGVKDYIIDRKQEKIEKLEKKRKDEGDEWGEEGVTPESKKAIKKEIEGALKPVLQTIRTQSDEQELKDVLTKYPDAEKMEKQIRKYMSHEAYKNASVEFIYLGLAAKKMDLQKKRDKADEEAKADKSGGHGKRKKDLSPIPDVRDMDDKDFDDLMFKVKTGRF